MQTDDFDNRIVATARLQRRKYMSSPNVTPIKSDIIDRRPMFLTFWIIIGMAMISAVLVYYP